ncbi:unnamed protein product [Moneuplotes crassus]|uniref:Uncharacterized protein n=1 Tax=Euplotes crassus TaxID=5936 RepID=A0AAD1UGM2_EUPCR|nr:unnamed protein product [Moneuplotes crassus]
MGMKYNASSSTIPRPLSKTNSQFQIEHLNQLFSKLVPTVEKRRSKERKLILKYDKLYTKMKLREDFMFKKLSNDIDKVVNSQKEKHIFLKNNIPFTTVLVKDLKHFVNIKVHEHLSPLRLFIKNKTEKTSFKLYFSRSIPKPCLNDCEKSFTNPSKITIKSPNDELIFSCTHLYFTIIPSDKLKMTLGYCFNSQLPARELLPEYKVSYLPSASLKSCRTTLEAMQYKFLSPDKIVQRRRNQIINTQYIKKQLDALFESDKQVQKVQRYMNRIRKKYQYKRGSLGESNSIGKRGLGRQVKNCRIKSLEGRLQKSTGSKAFRSFTGVIRNKKGRKDSP